MSLEAMKQALEALEHDNPAGRSATITALRQAIAEVEKQEPVANEQAVIDKFLGNSFPMLSAITEQPKQEPVAWYDSESGVTDFHSFKPVRKPSSPTAEWLPLYTTPPLNRLDCWALIDENQRLRAELKFNTSPSKREWVGLTEENIEDAFAFSLAKYIEEVDPDFYSVSSQADYVFARALEDKLKEKNA